MSYKSHQLIKDHDVKWVDLRFTDTKGKQQHVTMPARDALDDEFFEAGKMFDGSSIAGWKGIEASDMILMPDDSTAVDWQRPRSVIFTVPSRSTRRFSGLMSQWTILNIFQA